MADGSIGTLHYFANGDKSYPKETFDVFSEGRILRLDNFRALRGWGWPQFSNMKMMRQDKGHRQEFEVLTRAIRDGGPPVMPFDQIENVTRATFAAAASARNGQIITL